MPTYSAPLRDLRFLLEHVFDYESSIGAIDLNLDTVMAVLDSAATFVQEVVVPLNLPGDEVGCCFDRGAVATPPGYAQAYRQYCEAGWPALAADPSHGGQGLPASLGLIVRELVASGSMAFGMYTGLSLGAYRAIAAHGSESLKEQYLARLAAGAWAGTMCMTEPECGSDLSRLRTVALPVGDSTYRVSGTKIFISGGEHDLTENIVHLVLARLPGAPSGTRGLSLFVVPKLLPDSGKPNGVICGSIEKKMGIRASATAVLHFDQAKGILLGKENEGMQAMFTMMNSSRIGVAVQSVGAAEMSYQNALIYARERRQGRTSNSSADDLVPTPIIRHPDVRRSLLTMKALVEGARALYIETSLLLDIRVHHVDPEQRAAADAQLALLTPVLKGFVSECAVQATDLGIQIYGGHGYVHEHGMEQLYRDARVVPLYEGTNAIQALDLVHRKIGQDDGKVLLEYFGQLECHILAGAGHVRMAAAVAAALTRLRLASTRLRELRSAGEHARVNGAASDYLRLFGLVAMGGMWLRMAHAANTVLAGGDGAHDFLTGKMKTADFYCTHLLPESEQIYQRISTGSDALLAMCTEEF